MAGYLKSSDLGPHPHEYGAPHPHHHHAGHLHTSLGHGMPMSSLPFGLTHGLDAASFPQSVWGKYETSISILKVKQNRKSVFNIKFRFAKLFLIENLF